ncbi:hypothetical protein KLP40_11525 [Hymenobacter sp. NST-14]|uniref:hypothetical protein n=1 Tax=Hymenobacter piscis TaxID=2839984 RepID=UPI001C019F8D|nr:hypothetical protein [Hymenobacter piscis]MBT9393793.1 hypothetical protein [Hymenobacter piscis]
MKLLDYARTATLVSRHPPHEIARRLTVETAPTKWYDIFTMQQFVGDVYAESGFRIQQTGRSQLRIQGSIRPLDFGGSQIDLTFENRTSNKVSRAVLLLIVSVFLLTACIFIWREGFSFTHLYFVLIPLLMVILINLGPNMEYDLSLMRLRELLNAKNAE